MKQNKYITPKQAQSLLKRDGIVMSEKDAGLFADFLAEIGEMIIDNYIDHSKE